jgi:hypothetical protein
VSGSWAGAGKRLRVRGESGRDGTVLPGRSRTRVCPPSSRSGPPPRGALPWRPESRCVRWPTAVCAATATVTTGGTTPPTTSVRSLSWTATRWRTSARSTASTSRTAATGGTSSSTPTWSNCSTRAFPWARPSSRGRAGARPVPTSRRWPARRGSRGRSARNAAVSVPTSPRAAR